MGVVQVGSRLWFAVLFLFKFLFQLPDFQVLFDYYYNQDDRENWPENAKDPYVDCVIANSEKVSQPKKNIYT
ncbi:MAG: hypothetical protein JXL85_09355 [Bacilli bacterium]|nr:hypothetical protein [Bacilli bacterium]